MKNLTNYPIQELKLIYNLLHTQLPIHTELFDSQLLQDLQTHLVQQAISEGIDMSQDNDWANWLSRVHSKKAQS
jgi:hypothetical protein